jgi:nuclear pore complex protein Nup85
MLSYGKVSILCHDYKGSALIVTLGEDEFLELVDTMPPTLLSEAPIALKSLGLDSDGLMLGDDDPAQTTLSVFASRLTFLSELRDYILFLKQGTAETRGLAAGRLVNLLTSGITPAGFWAVLLVESISLAEGTHHIYECESRS